MNAAFKYSNMQQLVLTTLSLLRSVSIYLLCAHNSDAKAEHD